MEEVEIVRLTEADIQILKKVIGKRLYYFYTESIKVEATGKDIMFWANEFALALTSNKSDINFINISADYRLTSRSSTTYYDFEIGESKNPLRKEKLLQSGLYSEIKTYTDPILMIEIYQDWNQEFDESVYYDAAIVLYSDSAKYMLKVREELIGGIDIILDEATIEAKLIDLKLRQSVV